MTSSEQRVYRALQAHAFNGPTCHPSQELLAHETGLSRKHVGRLLRSLREQGLVTWKQQHRAGCKWRHNVYELAEHSPPKRAKTLNLLREIRASQASCPTERTAKPKRAQTTVATPTARVVGKEHTHLTTDSSSTSENQEIEQLKGLLRDSEAAIAELGQQLAGLQHQLRRAGQAEMALRNKLREMQDDEPNTDAINGLLGMWREEIKGGDKRCQIKGQGPRRDRVKWALKKYEVPRLEACLHGVLLDDWAMGRDPRTKGRPFNDIAKHIFKDEETIERFERLYLERKTARPSRFTSASTSARPDGDPLARLLDRLEGVKQLDALQWSARCPAHEDRHSSLSVSRGQKGVLMHCHAGCSSDAIAHAVGVPLAEWFDPDNERPVLHVAASAGEPLPTGDQLQAWARRLQTHSGLLRRLQEVRGWQEPALTRLRIGWDDREGRLTLPVYDQHGTLLNVLRYLPGGKPKMLAVKGRQRGLFPAPEFHPGEVWLVEGEPDAITAHQIGLPGVAVPGANGWRDEWAPRFADRHVTVLGDCDAPGRQLAQRAADCIVQHAAAVRVLDPMPALTNGYDLSDWVRDGATLEDITAMAASAAPIRRLRAA